ncbi:MAG: hypothetical protein CL840_20645, partial [Crocinitomicaceae bacterium]|nr:hypothetical protein [Crocinitomicaceae bacterium]
MKSSLKLFLGLFLALGFFFEAGASHYAGGSIKYEYLGPASRPGFNRYKIRVGIMVRCERTNANHNYNTTTITATCSTGGTPITQTLNLISYMPKPGERQANNKKRDVSDICRQKDSWCKGRTIVPRPTGGYVNGYEEAIYEGVIELNGCNSWTVNHHDRRFFARNRLQNFNANSTIELKTIFNTLNFPKNSAPNFADEVKPMPSACLGQDVFYGIGTTDPNGDSLRFELTCPDNAGRPAVGINGFTCTRPITNLRLDSSTGLISFKHTGSIGRYAVAFWVKEYERCTGKLKGQTRREIQFDISACSNKVPRDISGISNIVGNATKTGRFKMEVCQGEKFSWEDTIYDADITDTLIFESNINEGLPGATMNITSLTRNKAVVKFEWTAVIGLNPIKTFFISFDDNKCDYPGNGFSLFEISVLNATSAGPDRVVCIGDSVDMSAYGGRLYDWRSISGDPLVVGVNWFPDTTIDDTNKTGIFIPINPTILEVKSDLKVGCMLALNCRKLDTIFINPVDSFSLTTVPDFFLCNPGEGKLDVSPSRTTMGYKFKWDNSSLLTDPDTTKNPSFSNIKFPTRFGVTVTGDSGCVKEDYVDVNVTDPFPT